jgi:hypothetical protein
MLEQFNTLVSKYQSEVSLYASKPTKASSKRLRGLINQMKKIATAAKAELLAADKGE